MISYNDRGYKEEEVSFDIFLTLNGGKGTENWLVIATRIAIPGQVSNSNRVKDM